VFEKAKKLGLTFVVAALVFVIGLGADPGQVSHASPTTAQISARITALTGLQPEEIDAMFAAEQRPNLVLIASEIVTPIVIEPRTGYLLVRVAATQQWIRVLVDQTEWKDDFRPYLEAQGVTIHEQPVGTIDLLTPAQEAANIIAAGSISGEATANIILHGSPAGPSGSPAAAPQPHVEADPGASSVSDQIGTLAGEFRVNESGAATYSVPIAAPTGTAGVAPGITLNYSSSGANGIAGLGWSLGGLSAISRCRSTLGQDDVARPITWTNDDQFCLDGQRLILTSGTHGAAGAVYRTEIDTGTLVTIVGSANGGPDYFEARRKDGSTSYYGKSPNSTDGNAKLNNTSGNTLTWAIRHFTDSAGNPIWFDYDTTGSAQRIVDIKYAYGANKTNPAASHGARIRFDYETRSDKTTAYIAGSLFTNDQRLASIRVYNTVSSEQLVRQYDLAYGENHTISTDSLSRLTSIEERLGSTRLPKTVFDWRLPYLSGQYQTTPGFTMATSGQGLVAYRAADIDGDGQMDLVWVKASYSGSNMQPRLNYAISNGSDFVRQTFNSGGTEYCSGTQSEVCLGSVASTFRVKLETFDFNADGRTDVAIYDHAASTWRIYLSEPQGDGNWKLSATSLSSPIVGGTLAGRGTSFIDVNSDGLVDAVTVESINNIKVRYMTAGPAALIDTNHYYRFGPEESLNIDVPIDTTDDGWLLNFYSLEIRGGNADFNGDGRADFMLTGTYESECVFENPNPEECPPEGNLNAALVVTGPNSVSRYVDLPSTVRSGRIQTVDINADGLADFVYPLTHNAFGYQLNKGDGTLEAPVSFNESTLGQNPVGYDAGPDDPQFVDWNMDGYPDLAWKQTDNSTTNAQSRVKFRAWNPTTNAYDPSTTTPWLPLARRSKNEWVMFADMNGDAAPDMVQFNMDSQGEVKVQKQVETSGGTVDANRAINRVEKITNGFGASTYVSYEPLTDTSHYERLNVDSATGVGEFCESEPGLTICYPVPIAIAQPASFYQALNGDWDLPAGSQTLGKYRPVLEFNGPMYVVTRVEGDAPTADINPRNVDDTARNAISYYYSEAKIQASGRGMLGFERLKTVDQQTGIETTTFYRQDWPFIGHPRKTEARSAQGHLLSQAVNDWAFIEYTSNSSATASTLGTAQLGPIHPVIAASSEFGYGLLDDGTSQGALLSETNTTTSFDAEANPDVVVVTSKDGSGNTVKSVSTDNDYFDTGPLPLREARLSRSTVTTTYEGQVHPERVSAFTYHTSGNARGLLHTEIVEPTKPAFTLTTTHGYDQFGNRVKSSVQGGAETRCNADTVGYDVRGRYVEETFDCLGRKLTEVTAPRNKFGLPTQSKALVDTAGNGVVTDIYYGALGREYFRRASDGSFTRSFLTNNPAAMTNCPAGSVYMVQVANGGGASSEECYDKLARPIRTLTQGFDGAWDVQDTEYDHLGRIVFKSDPYDLAPTPTNWTRLYYDRLGRVTMTVLSDNSSATSQYNGLTTIHANNLGHKKTEVRNVLGEITDVYDNLNSRTRYWYDYQGNLRRTEDLNSVPTVILYDLLGRKKETQDPDKGTWTYDYNHFGELKLQTSANGHTSTITYDGLGRMKTRTDTCFNATTGDCAQGTLTESHTTWYYDTAAYGLGQLASVNDTESTYARTFTYDSLGRPSQVTTNIDGGIYYEKTTYDQFGRIFQVFDAGGDGSFQDSGVQHTYNAAGYLETVGDAVLVGGVPRTVYRQVTSMNARGQVTGELLGNGVLTTNTYTPTNGRLTKILSQGPGGEVQDLRYEWDTIGNLKYRREFSGTKTLEERFDYDLLNRLIEQEVTGETPITVNYYLNGNINTKSDVGTYSYGANGAGPHAVTAAGGVTYSYDANGNNELSSDGRTIKYTTFDKPYEISKGGHTVEFAYGPDRSRYRRIDTGADGVTTTRYIGSVEIIDRPNNVRERKRHIAGIVIETSFDNTGGAFVDQQTFYLHKDHLGSLDVMTSSSGHIVGEFSFDAWGQRRDATDWTALLASQLVNFDHSITTRGYTGHEMLDEVGVIHMNGRIYDQKLARFLQADPFVQDPTHSQSLNRYSYAWNNPLNATDPSGFFLDDLFEGINKLLGDLAPIVSIAISVFLPGAGFLSFLGDFGAVVASGFIAGGVATGSLRGAVFGAFSAAAFYGVGEAFSGAEKGTFFGTDLKAGAFFGKVGAHGVVGGVTAELQGGKFGHGFLSAGVTQAFSGKIGQLGGGSPRFSPARIAASAAVGGTVSSLTGGKFANGAVTAAFSRAFNDEATHLSEEQESSLVVRATIRKLLVAEYDGTTVRGALKIGRDFNVRIKPDGSAVISQGRTRIVFDDAQKIIGSGLKVGSLTVSATVASDNTIKFSGTLSTPAQLKIFGNISFKYTRRVDVGSAYLNNTGFLGEAARGIEADSRQKRQFDEVCRAQTGEDC